MARPKPHRSAAARRPPAPAPEPSLAPWRLHLAAACALAALTAIAYASSFHAGFVLDNRPLILQDPRVQSATWENVRLIFNHSYWWPLAEHGLYRPFAKLTYLFDYAVLGHADHPAGYHAVNLALHVLNVVLVYALAIRLVRAAGLAAAIAAVWAVHPVLTEAVTNIIGRADLLAACGVLGGLWCYLQILDQTGRRRTLWLVGLAGASFVGVFSKESGVTLVGAIVLHALIFRREPSPWRPVAAAAVAMAPALLLFAYLRSAVMSEATAAEFHFVDNPLVDAPFLLSRLTAIRVVVKYLALLVWPAALSNDYSYAQIPLSTGAAPDWLTLAALLAGAAAAGWLLRRHKTVLFLAGLACITFIPVSNLLFTTGTIMAERLLYLPSVGIVACMMIAIHAAADRWSIRWLAPLAAVLMVAALGARTWLRNADWHDDVSIWSSAVRAAPNSFEAHRGLAVSLHAADPSRSNLGTVIAEMERSLAILDGLPDRLSASDAYADAGFYYQEQGAYQKSREVLLRGVAIDRAVADDYVKQEVARGRDAASLAPVGLPVLYERLAVTHVRLGENDLAVAAARHARTLEPLLPDSHKALAWVLASIGRPADAAVALVAYFVMSGDARIVDSLRLLYGGGVDQNHCAIAETSSGPTLNITCPLVRDELCRASVDVAEIYHENRRPDLADQIRARAARSWGCSAAGPAGVPR